jgi:hypothetical protein
MRRFRPGFMSRPMAHRTDAALIALLEPAEPE